jgi:hypothetical protein
VMFLVLVTNDSERKREGILGYQAKYIGILMLDM